MFIFKTKPFPASIVVMIILLALHIIGSYYSWYWLYPWFDTVVHIIAGAWVGLVFLWLASCLGQINSMKEYKVKSFLIALVSALLLGVVWELLENLGQITFTSAANYNLDTALDLISDGVGGAIAYLYFVKKRRCPVRLVNPVPPFYNQVKFGPNI